MSSLDVAIEQLNFARISLSEGDVAWARHYLHEADALLAAEEQRIATEPQVSPAPVSTLLPDAGADSEGEPFLPDSPSRWCLKCGNELTPLEDDTCWRCVPKGDAS